MPLTFAEKKMMKMRKRMGSMILMKIEITIWKIDLLINSSKSRNLKRVC